MMGVGVEGELKFNWCTQLWKKFKGMQIFEDLLIWLKHCRRHYWMGLFAAGQSDLRSIILYTFHTYWFKGWVPVHTTMYLFIEVNNINQKNTFLSGLTNLFFCNVPIFFNYPIGHHWKEICITFYDSWQSPYNDQYEVKLNIAVPVWQAKK